MMIDEFHRPLTTAALSPPPPLTAQDFPSRLVLTDLRVLIVRMMQAPRDDRIDSPFCICWPRPTYLVLTVAVLARRRATGHDAAPTRYAYTSIPLLLCLYFADTYYADAYEVPRTTTPILTPSYLLRLGTTRLEDDQAHAINQLCRVAA